MRRISIRNLMIVVAISGALSGAERLRRRSVAFGATARLHGQEERRCILRYQAEEAAYLRRCQRLIARGVLLKQSEIERGLAEAWALWPKIRGKRNPNIMGICTHGTPDDYDGRLAWNLGTPSDLASYHSQLKRKYERAACFPWLAVDPDPPGP